MQAGMLWFDNSKGESKAYVEDADLQTLRVS